MGRLARSYALFTASLSVLRSRKSLLLFPVLSGIVGLLVAAVFLTPAFFASHAEISEHGRLTAGSWVIVAAFYVAVAFVATFFNAALISQADVALRGEEPRVGAGLAAAGRRWPQLLGWAVISATVSLVLRAIEERLGFLGRLLGGLAGMAWRLVTFLVLPAVVLGGDGIRPATKRSAELLRRTWGENLAGNAGIGLIGFLLSFAGLAVFLVIGFLLGGNVTLFVCLGLSLVWVLLVSIVTSTLSVIYQTALYRFAADGVVSSPFAGADLPQAFVTR